jgi:hypothetical protein
MVKYLSVISMFFFIKKINNSGYNSDQLNKLILFESYEKKKKQEATRTRKHIYKKTNQ